MAEDVIQTMLSEGSLLVLTPDNEVKLSSDYHGMTSLIRGFAAARTVEVRRSISSLCFLMAKHLL